jgi:transposase InsO family protein
MGGSTTVDIPHMVKFLDPLQGSYRKNGIVAQYSTPGESQQNGVAGRRNRTLMDILRSMISYSTLPTSLWMEALKTAAHILNRVPSKSQQQLSLLSQASWGRLKMKPTENKNKKHKKGIS